MKQLVLSFWALVIGVLSLSSWSSAAVGDFKYEYFSAGTLREVVHDKLARIGISQCVVESLSALSPSAKNLKTLTGTEQHAPFLFVDDKLFRSVGALTDGQIHFGVGERVDSRGALLVVAKADNNGNAWGPDIAIHNPIMRIAKKFAGEASSRLLSLAEVERHHGDLSHAWESTFPDNETAWQHPLLVGGL